MRKFAGDISQNLLGNIKYRNNVVTGEIAVDNGNYTYDVYMSSSTDAYPGVPTTIKEPEFAVGDAVEILIEYGNKEMPIIIGYAKKVVQEAEVIDINTLVTTLDAYGTSGTSSYLEGRIENIDGYENCLLRGFHYGLTTSYGTDTYTTGSFEAGSYSLLTTGLTGDSEYNFVAYVYDADGDEQTGDNNIFTTLEYPIFEDIGNLATDRSSYSTAGNTYIDLNNPSTGNGIANRVALWASTDNGFSMLNTEVATFYRVSGNNFSTRDTHWLGTFSGGIKRIFAVSLDVVEGDYIGMYFTAGTIESDAAGGMAYKSGDNVPCTNATFTTGVGTISLFGYTT